MDGGIGPQDSQVPRAQTFRYKKKEKKEKKKDHIKELDCVREKAAIIWFDYSVVVVVKVQVINVIN